MFAAVAICSMGIGIGANTAVFSVFNALLLRPFPYPEPGALVAIYETSRARDSSRFTVSPPDFLTWRANATTLQTSAAYRGWTPNLTGIDQAERLTGLRVSGDFFDLLGVTPIAGRVLGRRGRESAAHTVAISEALWRRLFRSGPEHCRTRDPARWRKPYRSPASYRGVCSFPPVTSMSGRRSTWTKSRTIEASTRCWRLAG